ncbi:hypothetical protein TNCV_841191 [Trichonephila clavipes]|nr:hypothetical protein TNCV_841191 [Trichonephila clavipes]
MGFIQHKTSSPPTPEKKKREKIDSWEPFVTGYSNQYYWDGRLFRFDHLLSWQCIESTLAMTLGCFCKSCSPGRLPYPPPLKNSFGTRPGDVKHSSHPSL